MQSLFPANGDILVLGGGIVGITVALELLRSGHGVTVIDRGEPATSTAANNAGQLCFSHIDPMVDAKSLAELPFMLMRSTGPLFVSKGALKSDAPWFKAALLSCRGEKVGRSMAASASLNKIAWEALESQCVEAGIGDHLNRCGVLYAYTNNNAWRRGMEVWEKKAQYGIEWEVVSPKDLPDMAPTLHREIDSAVYVKTDGIVSDPRKIVTGLADHVAQSGARFERRHVEKVGKASEGKVEVTLDGGEVRSCDGCVVALGAWSDAMAGKLGDKVLLTSQRGYNLTFPEPNVKSNYPVIIEDLGLAVSPLSAGLRIGGWVEFDEKENPPSGKVMHRLMKQARSLFPKLQAEGVQEWMGNRPATPDSLPVIGPSPNARQVIYAFGHGHLGLTQSAATARCVAAIAAGENPEVPLAPFGIDRFA